MQAAVEAGELVTLDAASTLADGIAVRRAGEITFEHVQSLVDDVVTVTEEEIASAILYLLEKEKTVAEGAGAVGVAALMHHKLPGLEGKRVCSVISGGNIDVNVVARVIERGLVKDGRLVRVNIRLLDKPGQLTIVSGIISGPARQRHRGAPLPGLLREVRGHHAAAHARDARPGARRGDPRGPARARVPGRAGVAGCGRR